MPKSRRLRNAHARHSSSQANVLLHVLDPARIIVDLLLHLTLVFLQVGEPLLQKRILLLLRCERRVVRVARELQLRYNVRHVVLIHRFEHVPHLFNLASV